MDAVPLTTDSLRDALAALSVSERDAIFETFRPHSVSPVLHNATTSALPITSPSRPPTSPLNQTPCHSATLPVEPMDLGATPAPSLRNALAALSVSERDAILDNFRPSTASAPSTSPKDLPSAVLHATTSPSAGVSTTSIPDARHSASTPVPAEPMETSSAQDAVSDSFLAGHSILDPNARPVPDRQCQQSASLGTVNEVSNEATATFRISNLSGHWVNPSPVTQRCICATRLDAQSSPPTSVGEQLTFHSTYLQNLTELPKYASPHHTAVSITPLIPHVACRLSF
ncbi:uncharacterized protein [Hetaerina americana]|uniref:uncharacterized protein n=1 Tax=Hetaerina americana TaxID=62018 RepID=UPI003A7F2146